MKHYLAVGEIAVGAGIVILSVGFLPLWAAFVGLGFFAMGISGLPWTGKLLGSGSTPEVGGRFAGVLLIVGFLAWLALPRHELKRTTDVALSAAPAPPAARDTQRPVSGTARGSKPAPASSSKPASMSSTGTAAASAAYITAFSAKHKHRFRDCEGILSLSVNSIRFETSHSNDSFIYSIDQVVIDGDGIRDQSGKAWHFAVDGRDIQDVLKHWKAGALLPQ